MTTLQIRIGVDLQREAEEIKAAIRRHEAGEDVHEAVITFESWDLLTRLLTSRRLDLLRHLHRHPQPSIRSLAKALGRDYANVHADVRALAEAGLIDDADGLRFDFDEIELPRIAV